MAPSLIYSASKSVKHKINWITKTAESEWTYFGIQNDTNKPLVIQSINEYFIDSSLYLVLDPKESYKVQKYEIIVSAYYVSVYYHRKGHHARRAAKDWLPLLLSRPI